MSKLNDFLGSAGDSELKLDEITIRKNSIIFNNYCIQISNISSLRLFNVKDAFPKWTLIGILIGLGLLTNGTTFIFGLIAASISGYYIYKHMTKSEDHLIQIMTNHGFTYSIVSKQKDFSQKIIDVITNIINGDSKKNDVYNFDFKNCVVTDSLGESIINIDSVVTGNVENKTS